tara:strand:+ start:1263 stop:1829 length:567 start_codon:yes stop_codon:yes gene_type:complete
MIYNIFHKNKLLIIILCISLTYCINLYSNTIGESTGYKIPRFVSLQSNESNLRIGPRIDFPIILKYNKKNFPVEIIDESGQWRQTKDIEGNVGWMHESLFQGDRYGLINTKHGEGAQILFKPEGKVKWEIGNNNIVKINKCILKWCNINYKNKHGWINKINLWGIYQNEKFNIPFYQSIINFIWQLTN